MRKGVKLITILLSVVFCFSVCSLTLFAEDANLDGYDDDTGEAVVTEAPAATDPVYTPTEAPTEAQYDDYTQSSALDTDSYDSDTDYYSSSDNYDYNSSSDYDYDYNYDDSDSYDSGESSYVGGGQTYTDPVSTAPSAALYDTDDDIDDDELSDSDWSDIAANLKLASSSDSDEDDFSFIQNSDSSTDNGDWMLIVGIICLILSAVGIAYFVISTVMRRKKLKKKNNNGRNSQRPAVAGAGASASRYNTGASSKNGNYRSRNDYSDGYRSEKKKSDRRSKYDTADVSLPKSSQSSRYKNSDSGKRYK